MNPLAESWADPHARHAMLVHLPIVLAMVGVLPVAMLVFLQVRGRCEAVVWRSLAGVSIGCFLVGSLGALLAANAGHDAVHRLMDAYPPLQASERQLVDLHGQRGQTAWIWPLIPAALLGLGLLGRSVLYRLAEGAALIAAIGVAYWFGLIGHVGGRLDYVHGIGVPQRPSVAAMLQQTQEPGTASAGGQCAPDDR